MGKSFDYEDNHSQALKELINESINERKQKRRSKFIFRLFLIIILVFIGYKLIDPKHQNSEYNIGLINIDGVISDTSFVNTKDISKSIELAFQDNQTKAIILNINSPGGSPVVSDNIYQEVIYWKKKYPNKPIFAVCNDLCLSGGYYIASSATHIFANKMSLVGSIGVKLDSFGFVDAIKKLGIERRVFTAGNEKAFLDPFLKVTAKQEVEINAILSQTHRVFVDAVLEGRKGKLNIEYKDKLFSGAPFNGFEAKKMGLIDSYGSINTIKRQLNIDTVVNYTKQKNIIEQLTDKFSAKVISQFSESTYILN